MPDTIRRKPPRSLNRRRRKRRPWWVVGVAVLLAAAGTAGAVYWGNTHREVIQIVEVDEGELPFERPEIPPEIFWMVPPGEDYTPPQTIKSNRPVVRIRRRADGSYELLYWGNPVRAAYTYGIENVGLQRSALVDSAGKAQDVRPLPVTVPARRDKRLPLQPAIPLIGLDGGKGVAFAARVTVRDAASGVILCFADYLLENPPAAPPSPPAPKK